MPSTRGVGIAADGLRREYGAATALAGVDFAVDGPEILGVAGAAVNRRA